MWNSQNKNIIFLLGEAIARFALLPLNPRLEFRRLQTEKTNTYKCISKRREKK